MRRVRPSFAVIAGLLFVAPTAGAQKESANRGAKGALFFRVQGVDTTAVASAEIVLPSVGVTMGTTPKGEAFLTDVPNGTYIVQARAPGYRTEMLAVRVQGDTVGTTFTLGRLSATELDTVEVNATRLGALADFERRRTTLSYGRFLTHEQIEKLGRVDLAAALRDVQGVEVSQGMGGPTVRARRAGTASACAGGMLIFVDGVLMTPGARTNARMVDQKSGWSDKYANAPAQTQTVTIPTAPAPTGSDSGGAKPRPQQTRRLLETNSGQANRLGLPSGNVGGAPAFNLGSIPLALIAGVEVYTGASIPPQFLVPGAAECGVLAIWTTGG